MELGAYHQMQLPLHSTSLGEGSQQIMRLLSVRLQQALHLCSVLRDIRGGITMALITFAGDPSMAEEASWGAGAPSGLTCVSLGKSVGM